LVGFGYQVHTPGEVFGTHVAAYGAEDEEWLKRVSGSGWGGHRAGHQDH
jgi:hypothetical protein